MEQHLRIALWMVFTIGFLQAKPTAKPLCLNMADLGLKLLSTHVTCDPSVKFASPSNVPEHCFAAALKCFQDGLQSENNCTGKVWRMDYTAEALEQVNPAGNVSSPDCQWKNKPFAHFVKDIETFAEQFNTAHGC